MPAVKALIFSFFSKNLLILIFFSPKVDKQQKSQHNQHNSALTSFEGRSSRSNVTDEVSKKEVT
jgi:hypothetical protein